METIIFATKNKGKIREINEILADMNVNVVSMEEAGITIDVVEDGKTFEENSMKKAVQVMEISGKITLADDSGLEIDYLAFIPHVSWEKTPLIPKNSKSFWKNSKMWKKKTELHVLSAASLRLSLTADV